ncbi:MAG: hypothetical protein IPL46_01730 [Saprospiraceae bacterium]|nr:hypothetical protein [Saprospiraceae bacterium]
MATRKVIIELKASPALAKNFAATFGEPSATLDNRIVPKLENLVWDEEFPVCNLPSNIQTGFDSNINESDNFYDTSADFHFSVAPEDVTYLARGTVDDANLEALDEEVKRIKM